MGVESINNPKRQVKLKKLPKKFFKRPIDPNGCTIYFQDNREMTVVNIVNQDPRNQNVVKNVSNGLQQCQEQQKKTPYFGQKRIKISKKSMEECLSARIKEENHFDNPSKPSITL